MLNHLKHFLLVSFSLGITLLSLGGCASNDDSTSNNGGETVLRVLNWEDYIYEADSSSVEDGYPELDVMDQFVEYIYEKTGEKISYVYDTFDTNETMFNELQTGKMTYDIIIPSDYMLQRMIANDMLEPFDEDFIMENADNYLSPYLREIFNNIKATSGNSGEEVSLIQYSLPYMWGTVGLVYNPEYQSYVDQGLTVDEVIEDFSSWDVMYDERYKGSLFIKDSMRDVYAVSVIHAYKAEIAQLKEQYLPADETTYNAKLSEIFNRCDDETIALVLEDMLALKDNSFGFEVDSGKNDVVTGKVAGNLAWSGDAVYSLDEAENEDLGEDAKTLYYSIPTEGSNIWFDGLAMPKSDSLNKELAQEFINFLYDPVIAEMNMYYVGYTPAVAGDAILEYVYDCYDLRGEIGAEDEEEYVEYDISYFFDGTIENSEDAILHVDEEQWNRQLRAQYPESSDLANLAIMNDFGDQNNAVIDMWEIVRNNSLPTWAIVVLSVELAIGGGAVAFFIVKKVQKNKRRKLHREMRKEA